MTHLRFSIVGVLASVLWIANASRAEPALKVSVDWGKTIAVSKTTPTIIACPFRPIPGATPSTSSLQDVEFSVLRDLGANYVRWHLINPSRQVAEIYPPTKEATSWDFSLLDEDMVRFLEATKGHEPIINFTIIPYWMFNTGQPIPHDSNQDDPNVLRGKYGAATSRALADPTGKMLGDYFARIVSWYSKGGFTDENGVYHRSGYHYDLPWWGVLNELDNLTPAQYTLFYDSIVSAVHAVSPNTKFVGLSLGLPSLQPEFFEYFLNPKNHRPGIPLDMVAYHFYAGAFGLGGSSENETIAHWQYTFFNQAAGLLSTVRYIESIRKRLSPTTRVNLDEIGAFLSNDVVSEGHPEKAKPVPSLYWNLNGSVFAYLYIELAKMGIDVATVSGIYDRPHGLPGRIPSITFIDPASGTLRAPIRVLQLIKDNFGPGDKLVSTPEPTGSLGNWFPELSSSDVAMQAFVTPKGKRLLAVNKRLHEVDIDLAGVGSIGNVRVVDEQSGDGPPRTVKPDGDVLRLGPFAVAVVSLQ
ncbi:MAG: glycosyl hydrolase family 39 [Acidobacteria bacterium]|nr:glycosyl hydrolase family 39 [Acidobacteriota bacterium]